MAILSFCCVLSRLSFCCWRRHSHYQLTTSHSFLHILHKVLFLLSIGRAIPCADIFLSNALPNVRSFPIRAPLHLLIPLLSSYTVPRYIQLLNVFAGILPHILNCSKPNFQRHHSVLYLCASPCVRSRECTECEATAPRLSHSTLSKHVLVPQAIVIAQHLVCCVVTLKLVSQVDRRVLPNDRSSYNNQNQLKNATKIACPWVQPPPFVNTTFLIWSPMRHRTAPTNLTLLARAFTDQYHFRSFLLKVVTNSLRAALPTPWTTTLPLEHLLTHPWAQGYFLDHTTRLEALQLVVAPYSILSRRRKDIKTPACPLTSSQIGSLSITTLSRIYIG